MGFLVLVGDLIAVFKTYGVGVDLTEVSAVPFSAIEEIFNDDLDPIADVASAVLFSPKKSLIEARRLRLREVSRSVVLSWWKTNTSTSMRWSWLYRKTESEWARSDEAERNEPRHPVRAVLQPDESITENRRLPAVWKPRKILPPAARMKLQPDE